MDFKVQIFGSTEACDLNFLYSRLILWNEIQKLEEKLTFTFREGPLKRG